MIHNLNPKRVDAFTRWMLKKEAKLRARGKPGLNMEQFSHPCNTPACVLGYAHTYPPLRRSGACRFIDYFCNGQRSDELYETAFSPALASKLRTALQAVNNLRKLAGLPRLAREDAK